MIYLVPNADCVCLNNNLRLFKGVKYELPQQDSTLIFFANDCYPLTLNLYEICRNFVNGGFLATNCQNYNNSNNANLEEIKIRDEDFNAGFSESQTKKINTDVLYSYNNSNNDVEGLRLNEINKQEENKESQKNHYNNSYNDELGGAGKIGWLENCKFACCCGENVIVFLNFVPICNAAFHTIKFKGNQIDISLSQNLTISIGGEKLAELPNYNLTYSHFETFNNFCFIYFLGARNFVAIVRDSELFYADYYDKIEFLDNEYYFLKYLKDSLNHGQVCHVSERQSEKYLVYLDEFDLNLKPEFLPHAFLDCLLAGNFKYCNALLCEELKQNEPNEIANFFCEFDWFYPLDNFIFALIKKDAVAGIYKFEIENDRIVNISEI